MLEVEIKFPAKSFGSNTVEVVEENECEKLKVKTGSELEKSLKTFKCKKCDKSYDRKSLYVRHHKINHSDKKLYCDSCEYSTKQRRNLKYHVRSVHENQMYECNTCEYKASRPYIVNEHIGNNVIDISHFKCLTRFMMVQEFSSPFL